ncbi:MAG TPA: DMT family transporter [Candidatus Saccharimonadales bacterium]|nr:DMT family transporter [Candidatus Saccharimonadales bacterium]
MLFGIVALLINQFFGNSVVPIGTKIAVPFVGPLIFVTFRFIIGAVVLFIIFLFSEKKTLKLSEYYDFILLGFLLMINVGTFTFAIIHTTVIMSTLIFSMTPVLVGVGAHFFLQEKFDRQKLAGLLVSFIGLLFLLSQSLTQNKHNIFGEPIGNILICISTVGYSCYLLYSRKVLHKKGNYPIQTTFLTFTIAAIFFVLISLCSLLLGGIEIKPISSFGIWGMVIVGIGSVIQYLMLQIGVKKTNAFTASLFQYIGPFIAASITIPYLHEQVTLQLLFGGLLVLIGVFIATTYKHLRRKSTIA